MATSPHLMDLDLPQDWGKKEGAAGERALPLLASMQRAGVLVAAADGVAVGRLVPLVQFDVMASVDLTACGGFRSLAPPPGGFLHGGSGPHFFQDVALYALPPGEKGCSGRLGPRLLTKLCRPTCPNPAHLVRKCACREVGSIELQEVAASLTAAGPLRFLNIKSQGYKINEYTAAQEWEAVAATGEEVPVVYDDERGVFKGPNAAGNQVSIPAQFVVVPKEE